MKPKVYTIRYQLDEAGWWVASIDGVRGVHTQGRSLSQARRRIREALPLFVHERSFSLVDGPVELPTRVKAPIDQARKALDRVEEAREKARA